ncbi:D-alanine--(R)-lactate ligase [Nocardioides sp. SYSU DS0651]|uniref:D-alanine--(R)-lactate ligase n=1 Tax=Nocardioides sp. SYSU DS0651 TaxID=3415955 RepID=UPI003F4B1078
MNRMKIGILFGGASEEHQVSVRSAQQVAANLDHAKYEPHWVGITRDGGWRLCDGPRAGWEESRGRPAVLSPDTSVHGLVLPGPRRFETVRLDVVLPVLHGRYGEDGAIQGLLALSGIPHVGCDIQSSALCMDKSLTYAVVRDAGIATPAFRILGPGEEPVTAGLRYPVFVKPARSGSSFGVSKVEQEGELSSAVEAARRYDAKVLIEEAVAGAEVGCAILGTGSDVMVGEVDQVRLSHGFFRIHQESEPERGSENATVVVPASLAPEDRMRVQEAALRVYRALGCAGLARVDMFLTDDGGLVLNEVNTLPGLTSYSRYPRMMAAAGLPLSEVIDRLVALALRRAGR